jgi:hypothetical protein
LAERFTKQKISMNINDFRNECVILSIPPS